MSIKMSTRYALLQVVFLRVWAVAKPTFPHPTKIWATKRDML